MVVEYTSPVVAAMMPSALAGARLTGGRLVPVNDLAVPERDLYADLVNRRLDWSGGGPARRNGGAWGR